MSKISIWLTAIIALITLESNAQANLPTSWDISGSTPLGWTINDIDYFSSSQFSGISPPAAKLNGTGDFIQIEFNEEPGPVTFSIQGSGNGPWSGTFVVQESPNGSSWSTIKQFDNGQIDVSNMTTYTESTMLTSRFVRFYYQNKVSGNNVALDDISLDKAPAGPAQEINILTDNDEQILSGGKAITSAWASGVKTLPLNIYNLGTQDTLQVDIASSSISGPLASEFSFISNVTDVPPGEFRILEIEFNPQAAGSRDAMITIVNNDADEGNYIINVTGYGDHIATEPSMAATMSVSQNLAYDLAVDFTNPDAENFMVLKSFEAPVSDDPTDKEVYEIGQGVGNAKVVYKGNDASSVINEILAGVDYYFAVYGYNGEDTFTNYLQSGAQTLQVQSDDAGPGNYYSGLDPTDAGFPVTLHQVIRPHFQIFYSNYPFDYLIPFEERDTVGDQKVISCLYSGEIVTYTPPFAFTIVNYSREHVFPQSWMPYSSNISDSAFYSDIFNLFTTRFSDVNELRSNFPLGEVDVPIQTYQEGVLGTSFFGGDTMTVYEPKDGAKGDAARAMFYMLACYDRVGGVRWKLPASGPFIQNQELLKKWHLQDPPSPFEKARNEFIFSLQNNRNPFIDNPEWACHIDFYNMAHIANPDSNCGGITGIRDISGTRDITLNVFPNPLTEAVNMDLTAFRNDEVLIRILDVAGRTVYTEQISGGLKIHQIDLSDLSPGTYSYSVLSKKLSASGKLMKMD